MENRNHNFDALKGYLILLVILGHLIIDAVVDSPFKQKIYFFHMPLFLAITGYFVSNKTLSLGVKEIFSKYWEKMIVPFLVAFIFYTLINSVMSGSTIDASFLTLRVLYPFYHLWYVPAVLLFIIYSRPLLQNYEFKFLPTAIFLGVGACLLFLHYSIGGPHIDDNPILKWFGDKRFYYYYYYFLLGLLIARFRWNFLELALLMVPVLLLVNFYVSNVWLLGLSKLGLNSCFIFIAISICERLSTVGFKFLIVLGQSSLPIYLWHVLPIAAIKVLLNPSDTVFYIIAPVVLIIFIYLIVFMRGRNKLIDKYILGSS